MGPQQEGQGRQTPSFGRREGEGGPGTSAQLLPPWGAQDRLVGAPMCRLARPTDGLPAATGLVRGAALRTFSLR